ncbi:MAG: YbaB/EbfC family nucleoid-associated protein [Propionibacteriaceae bacterium]
MGGFDFGGMNMSDIMAQAQAMQAQIANAQAELSTMTFTGTAGGGLVSAIVSGTGELEKVVVQPEACDPSDTESLGDLIVAAVRDAQNQMAAVAQAKLGVAGGGMGF